jgi:muconolactone D-isomerase
MTPAWVEFEVTAPSGTPQEEIDVRRRAEAAAAAQLAREGHLTRVWTTRSQAGGSSVLGLYSAESLGELDDLLRQLPLYDWMRIVVTSLGAHPNDPANAEAPR